MSQGTGLAMQAPPAHHEPAPLAAVNELPVEFVALEAAARAASSVAADAHQWTPAVRRAVLGVLDTVGNAGTVARARVVAAEQSAGTWALVGGARSLATFIGQISRQGPGAGFAEVRRAATLESMPSVAEAMVDGSVTPKHLAEITKATAASPAVAQELSTPAGQAAVVELARTLDGAAFGRKLAQFAARMDPAARQREHDRQRAKRHLTLTHTADGTEIRGFVDAVTGSKFQKVVDARSPRPAEGDRRSRDERQADALDAVLTQVLSDERTTPGAVAPVQAVVTFSEETWVAVRGTRGVGSADADADADAGAGAGAGAGAVGVGSRGVSRAPAEGSAADLISSLRDVPAVVDEDGRAWPASEIGRALCHCTLTRAVLGARGQVVDLGRADRHRLFNRNHWLALLAAGVTTCAVDGCSMPLRYSELHHIQWWENGGGTDLANLAPECSFHHHDIHKNDIRVARRPDGSYEHRWPDGRLYGGVPPDRTSSGHDPGPPVTLPLDETG